MKIFKNKLTLLSCILLMAFFIVGLPAVSNSLPVQKTFAAEELTPKQKCEKGSTFFGLKPWHAYLEKEYIEDTGDCDVKPHLGAKTGQPAKFDKLWLIALAILDDLLRIAGMVAVVFVMYGGIKYMMSRGQPDNTKSALSTIINALIGLAIAMVGAAVVGFIGNRLGP